MQKSYELQKLAELTNATLEGDPHHKIVGVADLSSAGKNEASFMGHPRYEKKVINSKAGAIFIRPDTPRSTPHNFLLTDDPYGAFQKVVELLYADQAAATGFEGIHPSAVIHPEAILGDGITVGPNAVIDKGAKIGSGTQIRAGAMIGLEAVIGKNCLIDYHAVVKERCILGNRVILHPGAVIGLCGYGYTQDAEGRHQKVHHYGIAVLGDDVEVGANTTIARARFYKTIIGEGTKIDSLVEIGHNVQTGRHCLIIGQSVVAGSTKLGDYVMLGGNTALDGHLEIASGVMLRAYSGVTKSIKEPGAWGGIPAQKLADDNRMNVHMRKIEEYVARIKELERKVQQLEAK